MKTLTPLSRMTLATSYIVLVLLPCLLIGLIGQLPRPAVIGTFMSYAFALLPTYHLDQALLGGSGFHSPSIFGLLAIIVAVMLWPFPVLSLAPGKWDSTRWRKVIFSYSIAFIAFTVFAAWRMTRSWELFSG